MKKKLIVIICVIVALVLLVPIPMRLKDGGTVEYNAILYSVKDVHSLNPDLDSQKAFIEGTIVEVLGIEIFNNVE